MMDRYGPGCVACGLVGHAQADHMIPRSQGGKSDVENGLPICGPYGCGAHDRKTAATLRIDPGWLTAEQIQYLEAHDWVAWDENGEPYGRGLRHFDKMSSRVLARRERVE